MPGLISAKSEDKTRKIPENKGFFPRLESNVAKVFGQGCSEAKKRPCFRKVAKKYYLLGFIQFDNSDYHIYRTGVYQNLIIDGKGDGYKDTIIACVCVLV